MPSATFINNSHVRYRVWETQTGSGSPLPKCLAQRASASSHDCGRGNLKPRERRPVQLGEEKGLCSATGVGVSVKGPRRQQKCLLLSRVPSSTAPAKVTFSCSKYWTKTFQIINTLKANKNLYAQPLLFGLKNSVGFGFVFFLNVIPRNYPKYCVYQQPHFGFCAHKISSAKHLAESKTAVNLRAQNHNQPPFWSASKLFFFFKGYTHLSQKPGTWCAYLLLTLQRFRVRLTLTQISCCGYPQALACVHSRTTQLGAAPGAPRTALCRQNTPQNHQVRAGLHPVPTRLVFRMFRVPC